MPKRRTRKGSSSAERVRRHRARRRAAGYRTVTRWHSSTPVWSDHRVLDARSLALHALAARRIAAEPRLLQRARATLKRWLERYGERPPAALREWQELLERPWQEVAAKATELSEDAARLRQSSPLGSLISQAERRRVYDAFRA
jgi:hypothetical protein